MNRHYCCLILLCLILPLGCSRQEDPITRVIIDAERSGIGVSSQENVTSNVPAGQANSARMLAGISQGASSTWVFKVWGTADQISEVEQECRGFIQGITFDDVGEPELNLPDGWKKVDPGSGMFAPFARLQVRPDLNLSVSQLPPGMDLRSNVNRWRGQLGLQPTGQIDLVPLSDAKTKMLFFDQLGPKSPSDAKGPGGMTPPFAGSAPFAGSDTTAPKDQPTTESPIEFATPEGWTLEPNSGIAAAKFSVGQGDSVAKVSVTRLQSTRNPWKQAAMNWAGEVGISLAPEELEALSTEFVIDEYSGNRIELVSGDDSVAGGLIGIRVTKDENAWFIKMTGAKDCVSDNATKFSDFAKSIQFKD